MSRWFVWKVLFRLHEWTKDTTYRTLGMEVADRLTAAGPQQCKLQELIDHSYAHTVREIAGVKQFRIREKQLDMFQVQIVKNSEFPANREERIRKWDRHAIAQWGFARSWDQVAQEVAEQMRQVISRGG